MQCTWDGHSVVDHAALQQPSDPGWKIVDLARGGRRREHAGGTRRGKDGSGLVCGRGREEPVAQVSWERSDWSVGRKGTGETGRAGEEVIGQTGGQWREAGLGRHLCGISRGT